MRSEGTKCPHDNIVDCPLYHAMHVVGVISCMSVDLQDGCLVDQGTDYETLVLALRVQDPHLVAQCEWNAMSRNRAEQHQRNMTAAGVH